MDLNSSCVVSPQAIAKKVGDETVILDLASGTYFGLDPVGARVWQLITDGKKLSEICTVMLEEYEVSQGDIERDALALAQDLADKGLISAGG